MNKKANIEDAELVSVTEEDKVSLFDKRRDANKKNLIECMEKSLGIVSTACKMANITRNTFYKYMADDPVFKATIDEVSEVTLDFAETSLLKRIKEGSDAAIIFYMKTKGKKRGYVERSEISIEKEENKSRPFFKLPDSEDIVEL